MSDYLIELRATYEVLRTKVRAGELPLEPRINAINDTVTRYVAHQDAHFDAMRDRGKTPPIQYRHSDVLDRLADLILHEELTWSHPDKMTIVDYPIMSGSQHKLRLIREQLIEELITGKDVETIGRKRTEDGSMVRVYDYMTPSHDNGLVPVEYLDLYTALEGAKLTTRQRQALNLVYFEGLTQEDTADAMGVSQPAIAKFMREGYSKIKLFAENGYNLSG